MHAARTDVPASRSRRSSDTSAKPGRERRGSARATQVVRPASLAPEKSTPYTDSNAGSFISSRITLVAQRQVVCSSVTEGRPRWEAGCRDGFAVSPRLAGGGGTPAGVCHGEAQTARGGRGRHLEEGEHPRLRPGRG